MPTKSEFIEAMAKHLPPSASDLRLLDIGGVAGEQLLKRRPDLNIEVASVTTQHWNYDADSLDAVLAYDVFLKGDLLSQVLTMMREGGRFILVNPVASVEKRWVTMLEDAGYVRILVEPAVSGSGVLIRGEKSHTSANTLKRVADVAERDANLLDLDNFKGRFVHLLIIQTPNKPVWKMTPDETIVWQAVAIDKGDEIQMLAFSSLPKAVNFMQAAVIDGFLFGVNKVGKFTKTRACDWSFVTLLNPTLADVAAFDVRLLDIDPNTAEASDE